MYKVPFQIVFNSKFPAPARWHILNLKNNNMAKITVAFMRDLLNMERNEEISFSRMVEILNEKAAEQCLFTNEHPAEAAALAYLSLNGNPADLDEF